MAAAPQIDASLASLFSGKYGPVDRRVRPRTQPRPAEDPRKALQAEEEEAAPTAEPSQRRKKRKRQEEDEEDDGLEERYMRKVAREEEADQRRRARAENSSRNPSAKSDPAASGGNPGKDHSDDEHLHPSRTSNLLHESVTGLQSTDDVERASRTVFFGNVSTGVLTEKSAKKILLSHIKLSLSPSPLQVESIRFRSTPYADQKLPKRAAFATGDVHDATSKSTNAYAVYKTDAMARTAVSKLNGTVILDRHLRADSVAHPSQVDHRRCVFVGNLDFVDDESAIVAADNVQREERTEGAKKRKAKIPGDVEEGLWREFGKVGNVESVRVIRDAKTRVSKGIAYVQFEKSDTVELALMMEGKKFPPLLPRKLRVTRAKNPKKLDSGRKGSLKGQAGDDDRQRSMSGRAGKLFGKAGAATLRKQTSDPPNDRRSLPKAKLDGIVFEGTRATKQGGTQWRLTTGKGQSRRSKRKKPTSSSNKRAAAFKASGGKKP